MNLKIKYLLFNLFILFIFLSPTKILSYILGYAFLFLNIDNYRKVLDYQNGLKLLLGFVILISFVFNVNSELEFKDYMIILNTMLLVFLFPYFDTKIIANKINPFIIFTIIIVIFLSQIAFIFDISTVKNIILLFYENEASERGFESFIANANRNGGLYFNPNQASKYLTMLLALSLCINENKIKYISIIVLLFSVLLTGSRTGLIISFIILLVEIFFIQKKYKFGIVTVFIGLLTILFNEKIVAENRSFQIKESGSLDYKLSALFDYLSNVSEDRNVFNLLFGNLRVDYQYLMSKYNLSFLHEFGFDAELGHLISFFGLIFLVVLLFFYFKQAVKIWNTSFILIIIPFVLWPVTSTILFSFKTSMVYMVVLGYALSQNKINKKQLK